MTLVEASNNAIAFLDFFRHRDDCCRWIFVEGCELSVVESANVV
jgi:hypothetical protein